jgi:hypothetical protein
MFHEPLEMPIRMLMNYALASKFYPKFETLKDNLLDCELARKRPDLINEIKNSRPTSQE